MHNHGHIEHLLMSIDVVDATTVWSIVWFSFTMSWHCAAMCGPIICTRFKGGHELSIGVLRNLLLYNLGRFVSYSLAGLIVGATVGAVSEFGNRIFPAVSEVVAVFFATVLAVQGCFLFFGREVFWFPKIISNWVVWLNRWIDGNLKSASTRFFCLGIATALLPCMTLSSALTAAGMTANPATAVLVMVGFLIGTIPVMMTAPLIVVNLQLSLAKFLSPSLLRRLSSILLILAAAITVLRIFH